MARKTAARIVYNHFPEIVRRLPGAAREIVQETIDEIDETVKHGMATTKSGRAYVRGGRIHIASAPGEMPAIDTTNLISSLQKKIVSGKAHGYYYTEVDYAPMLEYGTSEIAPRPFMTPAAEKAKKSFMRKFRRLEDRLR